MHSTSKKIAKLARTCLLSSWFFPSILTLLLTIMTIFSISGSSVGIYHEIFYGNSNDPKLLANHPQAIRSDEWLVGTQKTIAQANNHFKTINTNIGNGEDESVLVDDPTSNWSVAFRPENLAFFVLPLDHAFAFRWWLPAYSLMISVYLFVLVLLPGKRLLASLMGMAFTFSPFMQWWGAYMPAAWLFAGFVVFTEILRARKTYQEALWGALLSYMAVCFALILYPPFQIPAALVIVALALGYTLDHLDVFASRKMALRKAMFLVAAVAIAAGIVALFMHTHHNVVTTIQNTAYPGHRIIKSGGYGKANLFTGHLDGLLQNGARAAKFPFASNQSEASNFILLSPFLVLPILYLSYRRLRQHKHFPYIVMLPAIVGMLFMAWLFVPGLEIVGKLTLLNTVPQQRLIYGVGILDLTLVVLFIKMYRESDWKLGYLPALLYSLLVMVFLLIINFHVSSRAPIFIGAHWAVLLSLPSALIIYLLLNKKFVWGMVVLSLFSFLSIYKIQPLYVGLSVIRESKISESMLKVANLNDPKKKWVTDYIYLENFAAMNGLPSLSGTYIYPQLNIWDKLHQPSKQVTYNRYAHVTFNFDRHSDKTIKPVLTNPGTDQLSIKIEPCDPFLKTMDVGYLVTTRPFRAGDASCLNLAKVVTYPKVSFYIYLYR